MRFVFYKQTDSMDCGPACLRMVARHYGQDISLQYLREASQIAREGVSLLGISEAAENIGFRSIATKLNYQSLIKEARLPAILHWDQYHFVVLYKAGRRTLSVADPARGLIDYSPEEFRKHWVSDKIKGEDEGIALLLEPAPDFYKKKNALPKSKTTGIAFRNIINYVKPYRELVIQLFIGLAVASILQFILPFLTQSIVDTGIKTRNIHFIYLVLLAQLALMAGRLVVEFVRSWILLHISTRINLSILTDFLIKLMKLPVSFFDSKKTGDILQRMNDHSRIESFLTGTLLNVFFSIINLLVFSVVLFIYNINIFTAFAVAGILYAVWVLLFQKKRRTLDYKKFEVSSMEQGTVIQLVQGMQEIKLHGCEKPVRWKWEQLQALMFKLGRRSLALNQWQQAGAFFINEGKNILITFLSAKAVIDGEMTLGAMLAIQYIVGQLNSPVEQMISFVQSWQNARISMDRLNEIHEMKDEEPASQSFLHQLPPALSKRLMGARAPVENYPNNQQALASSDIEAPAIVFENVSFTYPGAGNEPVLKNINLEIPVGKTTAIVGVSGSGKTTLLKLFLKFYEPGTGQIVVRNDDELIKLSAISHKTWRSHCGVVMQDSFIFSDTIAGNIAIGVDKTDVERLNNAIRVANIGEFVDGLPSGFNTMIGIEGLGTSMGQRQRILIARAVYRDPDFIFFDEATNSLDANNESVILRNLEAFFEHRTVVIVAHRLSTVKRADQIVVLHKGEIVEKGTHQQLIKLKGEYYTLVKNQLELGE
ncbi:MAG: peptidase domain-containing ABC transporter [Chitinophagaceae bacterium]